MSVTLTEPETPQATSGLTDSERAVAFQVLALCSGNGRRAEKELAEHYGIELDHTTLYRWAKTDEYANTQAALVPERAQRFAQQFDDVAQTLLAAKQRLAERLYGAADDIDPADLPKSLKFTSDALATSVDKANLLRGQPTQRVEHTADETIRKLVAAGLAETTEGTATEITDAQTVEPLASPRQLAPSASVRGEDSAAPTSSG